MEEEHDLIILLCMLCVVNVFTIVYCDVSAVPKSDYTHSELDDI